MPRFSVAFLLLAALAACQSTAGAPQAGDPAATRERQRQLEQVHGQEREILEIERRQRQQRYGLGP